MMEQIVYGKQYYLWNGGKYLGIVFWINDEHNGDCFLSKSVNYNGEEAFIVYWKANMWELIDIY